MSRAPRTPEILSFPGPLTAPKPTVIFDVRVAPSQKSTAIVVECEGLTAEQLERIQVRCVKLAR